MKKLNFKIILINLLIILAVCMGTIVKIEMMKKSYENKLSSMKDKYEAKIVSLKSYEYLYTQNEKDLEITNRKYKSIEKEYNTYKETIAMSKQTMDTISRGSHIPDNDLRVFSPITESELNDWIKSKAPVGSPFIGRADVFIKASKETGLDPKYLVSHAATESAWGTSAIAQAKNNYFGIGSFNNSPYSSSYDFNDGLENGIIEGAKWIKANYIDDGQTSLYLMQYGNQKHVYCQDNSGNANPSWIEQIAKIMS